MTPPTTRRAFLRAGALALGGLRLVSLARAASAPVPTSVILFWMWGGPSHLETYDLKPDAPAEYRGPFRPRKTTVPGLDICELFPLQARQAHRFSLIRSLHHTMSAHNDGSIEVLTGKTPTRPDPTSTAVSEHPDFGMVVSRLRFGAAGALPPYVGIPSAPFMTRPGYLGLSHKGFDAGDPGSESYRPPNLHLAGVEKTRFDERRSLLSQFDRWRRDRDIRGVLSGADELNGRAFDLLNSPGVATAFDLAREEPRLRDRYGRHPWGQRCLLARRLVEAGVGAVIVDASTPMAGRPIYFSWDDHANAQPGWDLVEGMRWRAPFLDQALSSLIEDIYDRGLDKQVLVVAMGEFGRTPKLTRANNCLGRDHWPDAMSALVAGGGTAAGQVIGATNARGEYPKERPLTPQDLLATVYQHLKVDPRQEFVDFTGRPVPLLSSGQPIEGLV